MPPSDQEPRYQLVDSNGNVVGSLFGDGSGNVVVADETDTQTTFDADGITTPALEAKKLTKDYFFAGSYDGADADARLDNALSNASVGSKIYLERRDYTDNRTIGGPYNLVGVSPSINGTRIDGATWTLDTFETTLESVKLRPDSEIVVNKPRCGVRDCTTSFRRPVTVNADNVRITDSTFLDVTFASGTSKSIADSLVGSVVTDNGNNTIGDIS